ncbi:MAG: CvpA family protein [Bryobacteraceae bacterium]
MSLNWLDIVLIAIFAASVVGGILKGFAKLVIGLMAAIAGLLCGLWFYGAAGGWLRPYVSYPGLANFIGFVLIFAGFLLTGALLGALLSKALKWAGLSWADRLLGGAFGAIRASILAIALVLALMAFSRHPPPRAVVNSRFAPYVIGAAHVCAQIAPHEVQEAVDASYARVRELWEDMLHKAQRPKRGSAPPVIR